MGTQIGGGLPPLPQQDNSAARNWALSFSKFLRREIDKQGLLQVELADRLGVDQSRVSGWLRIDAPHRPNRKSCLALARALELSEKQVLREAGYDLPTIKVVPPEEAWQSIFDHYEIPEGAREPLRIALERQLTSEQWLDLIPDSDIPSSLADASTLPRKITWEADTILPAHYADPDYRYVRSVLLDETPKDIHTLQRHHEWANKLTQADLALCYNTTDGFHRVSSTGRETRNGSPVTQTCVCSL